MQYQEFLNSKIILHEKTGFRADVSELHPSGKSHQKDAVLFALEQGKSLCAMLFGLGKTHVQLDWHRVIHNHKGGKHLIIAPLSPIVEFTHSEGPRMGMEVKYIETMEDISDGVSYYITNYDKVRLGRFDLSQFTSVSLDEGNVLRSMDSEITDCLMEFSPKVEFLLVATATPAPNRYLELINYAHFLGVMDRGLAMTRFFQRDSQRAGGLTLYPGHEKEFYAWLMSWSFFLSNPSDLGYDDEGYKLPPLNIQYHRIEVAPELLGELQDRNGQYQLASSGGKDMSEKHRMARITVDVRVAKMREILETYPADTHAILWHYREDERLSIEKTIPGSISVYGSLQREERNRRVLGFAKGEIQLAAPKPEVCGSGCNWQYHCNVNIYADVTDKFDDWIQSLHRTYRFMQKKVVDLHLIYTSENEATLQNMLRKWKEYDELNEEMSKLIRKYGLHQKEQIEDIKRSFYVKRREVFGKSFTAINNDNVAEMPNIDSHRFGLAFTSIPFGNQYEYTNFLNDFGHNISDDAFFSQMDFLMPEVYRTLQPGRNLVIHVKDRILYGYQNGFGMYSVGPFSDKTVFHVMKHGFIYEGRRTIVTDVVRENAQTYRLGWSEACKDMSNKGCGSNEYILVFRKPQSNLSKSYADTPVVHDKTEYPRARWQLDASGFWRSSGDRLLSEEDFNPVGKGSSKILSWWKEYNLSNVYDYEKHVALCQSLEDANQLPASFALLPTQSYDENTWTGVNYMHGLNSEQRKRREQNHICPLPFDIVDRVIELYSNKNDEVIDFFAGLGTVPLRAMMKGRKGFGVELNPRYFDAQVNYLQEYELKSEMPTLFDLIEMEDAV